MLQYMIATLDKETTYHHDSTLGQSIFREKYSISVTKHHKTVTMKVESDLRHQRMKWVKRRDRE